MPFPPPGKLPGTGRAAWTLANCSRTSPCVARHTPCNLGDPTDCSKSTLNGRLQAELFRHAQEAKDQDVPALLLRSLEPGLGEELFTVPAGRVELTELLAHASEIVEHGRMGALGEGTLEFLPGRLELALVHELDGTRVVLVGGLGTREGA